jgi:hypothetical protein
MEAEGERLAAAIAAFDAANAADPNREAAAGTTQPRELLYARRMSDWLEQLAPDAPESLRLAVRCQHLCRWTVPRASYPEGRDGYLRWRADLKRFHAEKAGELLRAVGYDEGTIGRVQALVRKERFKTDPEAQLLEDVACLVFLEHYFAPFAAQHPEEKILNILRKTWSKMSARGQQAALRLELAPAERSLVEKALAR